MPLPRPDESRFTEPAQRLSPRRRLLIPVLFAPVFMVILDVFIVNVAAPSLRADLHASASEVQWVVAAYLLTYAVSLITAGRLGDVFGRRRMFRIGLGGFTIASGLCAAAPTASALIVARLLQGLAGAAMWPQVLSIIQVEFAPGQRRRMLGLQGGIQGLASVTGQIIGGGLIALDILHLGVAIVGTVFFSALGGRSGPIAYGQAFSLAMVVQVGLVLLSTGILTRASMSAIRTRRLEAATSKQVA